MSLKKKIIIGVIAVCVIAACALILIVPSKSPLEEEYEWYQNQGYATFKIDYIDFLDSLPPATVNEIQVSKSMLREKAVVAEFNMGGQCIVAYCSDEKMIVVLGDYDPSTEIATIYYWKP